MAHKGKTPSIGAVETTLEILEALRDLKGTGVTELADYLELPKSTVHSHLCTLERNEYVVKSDDTYRVGLRFLDYGEHARCQLPLYDISAERLDELAMDTGELVNLAAEEHGQLVYLTRRKGDQAVTLDTHSGKRVYMHSTALGKAILANMRSEEVARVIERHGLPAESSATITDETALHEELREVRDRGYALDDEERLPGLRCVAAPVKHHEQVVGAVSVAGPTSRIKGERFRSRIPELVTDTANVISINLTYS